MEQRFTMGQVARDAGVYKNTLKTWEEKGWIPKPKRERGGNQARMYTAAEREQVLEFARSRKELIDPVPPQSRPEQVSHTTA